MEAGTVSSVLMISSSLADQNASIVERVIGLPEHMQQTFGLD